MVKDGSGWGKCADIEITSFNENIKHIVRTSIEGKLRSFLLDKKPM